MNPEDVGRILDEIGERIGPAGEYAWSVLVTGERVVGVVFAASAVAAAVGAYVLYRLARWAYHKHEEAGPYDSHDLGAYAFGAGAAACAVAALILIGTALPSLIAPEYVVLRNIVGGVR